MPVQLANKSVISVLRNKRNSTGQTVLDDASRSTLALSGFGGPLSSGYQPVALTEVNSTALSTYAQLISHIDATIVPIGGVTKTDRGLCADGVNRIYEYKSGAGPLNVLIVCGQHGPELAGTWAMLRWFAAFAGKSDGVLAALSKMIAVSWVPSANPGAFRAGRKSPNDVDLNRNYPFYWSRYTPPDADNNKGSAAFSEPETQAIKAIIDARSIDAVIDCHNYEAGYSTYEMLTAPGSIYTRSNKQHWQTSVRLFNSVYGANSWGFGTPGVPLPESGNLTDSNPNLVNWSMHYMGNTLHKGHAASVLIESSRDMDGGTLTYMPASAVTKYAGYITTWLLTWLQTISMQPVLPVSAWQQRRFTDVPGTSISSGGTLLDAVSDVAMSWDEATPAIASAPRDYVDCPVTCKGYLDVTVEGTVENLSAATGRYQIGITLDGSAVTNRASESFTTSAVTGDRANFSCSARFEITTVDATYVPRIRATANKLAGAAHNLKRSRITVVFTPADPRVVAASPTF